ncbi:FUSC family protein [Kocuria sp. JC486]|uniref:FUSC family protein n=1 Tax=Kocuria sp. JC486 TaxID=1970736 RepID=UPI0014231AA6|nr:FUSC family protein [Kocuria sp. JC486]NHU86173.1 FUSC family protein [Kocuria sp. JC486]
MPTSALRSMVELGPARADHLPAARIALSVAVPLLLLLAMDRLDLSMYAAFGAFTAVYARQEPVWARFRHQALAGLLCTASVLIGAVLSSIDAPVGWVLAVTTIVAALGAVLAAVWLLKPAGSLFMVFATGAVGSLGASFVAPLPTVALVAGGAAAFSVLLGLVWVVFGEGVTGHVSDVLPSHGATTAQVWAHGGRFFLAAGLGGLLSLAVADSHNYWSQVAAVAPIAAPTTAARLQRGIHRVVGTLGGVAVTGFVLALPLETWHMVVVAIACQFLAELFIGRNYVVALLFVTPLALLMTQLVHPLPAADLLQARAVETVVGAAAGLLVVYLWRNEKERRADTQALPVLRRAMESDAEEA